MPPASHQPGMEETRAAVTARYSGLARAARAGQQISDCGPDEFEAGCFGAAGYDDTSGLPDGAVRASLGCGNPVAVAQLHPGETVLDLGSGGGIDVLLSARRVAPGGKAYGLDGSPDMIAPGPGQRRGGRGGQCGVPARAHRGHPAARSRRRRGHLQLRHQPVRRQAPGAGRGIPRAPPRRPDRGQRHHRQRRPRPRAARRGRTADRLHHRHPHRQRIPRPAAGRRVHPHHHRPDQRPSAWPAFSHRPGHPARRTRRRAHPAHAPGRRRTGARHLPGWPGHRTGQLRDHRTHLGHLRPGPPGPGTGTSRSTASGEVLGWAAATAVSPRPVYRGVIEHSIYIHPDARGRGIGAALLSALTGSTEADAIWTIQTGIFPENTASLRLHQQAGFRVLGTRQRIGCHHGRWRDVTLLERRSSVAGT